MANPPRLEAIPRRTQARLTSWKEIAGYLNCTIRTARRWELAEALPVHRHTHQKRDSVYAEVAELEAWWSSRQLGLKSEDQTQGSRAWVPRYWLAAGGILLAVALVAIIGILGHWPWLHIGSPALSFAKRDWVLITDFDNQTGEPIFDRSLLTAFTVSLEQSPHANVLPRARANTALQLMGRRGEIPIDERVGREVCLREHIKGMISGSITRSGREYAVSARLIDPQTAMAVRSYIELAADQDHVLEAMGRIAARIRRDLGESLASIRQNDDPLPQVTTPSLDALRLYSEGQYLWRTGQYEAAVEAYQSALKHDPDFAMAHAALGNAYMSHIFSNLARGKEHYEKALRRADRITDREQLFIQASYQNDLGHVEEAEQNYRLYLDAYPDDVAGHSGLAMLLMRTGHHEQAIQEFKSIVRLDPTNAGAWINLATSCNQLGRFAESLTSYAKAFELQPTWITRANLNHEYGFALVHSGDRAKAREVFALALAKPEIEHFALRSMALLDLYEGKYSHARILLTRAIALTQSDELALPRARDHLFLAILFEGLGLRADEIRELDRASEAVARWPDQPVWLQARIGASYARAGAFGKADGLLRQIGPKVDRNSEADIADLHILEGEVALAKGEYSRAIERLQLGAQSTPLPLGLASLARAYQKMGDSAQAIVCYEKLLRLPVYPLGWEPQQAWLAAHAELAEAYLSRGERAKAAAVLDELAALWKDADPDLPLSIKILALEKHLQTQTRVSGP